jgi:hypothetical protein
MHIMEIKTVGVDVGKSWFHLVACNQAGRPVARHKLNRGQLLSSLRTCRNA